MVRVPTREIIWIGAGLLLLLVLVYATVGVTPWGLIADAWRTVFGANTGVAFLSLSA